MKGFIVDETYRIEGGKAYVYLFGRLENGESFLTISQFAPYFAIRQSDVEKAQKVSTSVPYRIEETSLKSMQEDSVAKVILEIPRDVPELRKSFENKKIPCFEADIRFTQRFLMDHGILRSMEIEGEFEKSEWVSRIYRDPKLAPVEWYPKLRILALDIETSPDAKELYSISLACNDELCKRDEVLIINDGKKQLKKAKAFPDEKSLLEHFRGEILEIDPDIITGWNLIDFDLKIIREKFHQHKIPFRMARQDWDCTLRIESSFMKDSTAEFPGRQVLDGIILLKINFIRLDDYKLGTAAAEFLGEEKLIGETNKGAEITDAFRHHPQKLVDYNLHDSHLVLNILEKTDALGITINRAMLTGMSLERVKGSVASFDSVYLRELRKKGYVAQSSGYTEKEEGIKGGYVKESKPGIYDYIIVLDFKSLYPSILRTFNVDPLSYAMGQRAPKAHGDGTARDGARKDDTHGSSKDATGLDKSQWIVAPNGAVFRNDESILPMLIQRLWQARDAAKKKKNARASQAIKTVMNSFWGVLANPSCRFFSMEMANAITAFARQTIQLSIKKAEEMGYEVIYGDTDSIFVNAGAKSYEEAEAISAKIEKAINAFYDTYVKEEYRRTSYMELESDRIFVRFMMPRVRGSEEGSKKRYAGIVIEDGKEQLDVTGLEIVRRDWTDLAKNFQRELLMLIFRKEDPAPYIRQYVKDLRAGKHDDELLYRKAIRKELEGYTKTTPPHVKAARKLEEAGVPLTSSLIDYVMTKDGPEPIQLLKKDKAEIDYEHYVDKQIRPLADAVLGFFDTTFDDVVKGQSQKTLFGY
jgi:DNA polymerase-2